ncbi:bestrophin-1-like isoform X2 [Brevipalpus obovatus]
MSFVLGFYVSMVVGRWWQQFMAIPWPDKLCMLISGYIVGKDPRSMAIRAALMRYMMTMKILTLQAISTSTRRRYPNEYDLVDAGIMSPSEFEAYEKVEGSHGKWWVPAQWFTSLVVQAYSEGRIKHGRFLSDILSEMHAFRGNCGMLFAFDWVSIPLVYTQTVTICVYTYFGAKLIGRQFTESKLNDPKISFNSYVPLFTLFEFFFFMGWLKVAEQLINPFGEDDDDYDCNWMIDRNLLVSYIIIEEMHDEVPQFDHEKDFDRKKSVCLIENAQLEGRSNSTCNPHIGSTADLIFKGRRSSRLVEERSSLLPTVMPNFEVSLTEENLRLHPSKNPTLDRTMSLTESPVTAMEKKLTENLKQAAENDENKAPVIVVSPKSPAETKTKKNDQAETPTSPETPNQDDAKEQKKSPRKGKTVQVVLHDKDD